MRRSLKILADSLTIFRGAVIPYSICFLIIANIKSFFGLLVLLYFGWISDWYDGTLARKSGLESKIGNYEIVFDHLFVFFISLYLMYIKPLFLWITALLSFWLFLSVLAIYGTLRHKTKSFVALVESFGAPAITAGIISFAILAGGYYEKLITIIFLFLGAFHIKLGLKAKERVKEFIAPLPMDISNAILRLKEFIRGKK